MHRRDKLRFILQMQADEEKKYLIGCFISQPFYWLQKEGEKHGTRIRTAIKRQHAFLM